MKPDRNKELDDYFKNAMQPEDEYITYREQDWERMEELLGNGKQRPFAFWMRALGGIAATLLVAALVWWFIPAANVADNQQQAANRKPHMVNGGHGGNGQIKSDVSKVGESAGPVNGVTVQRVGRAKTYPGPAFTPSTPKVNADSAAKGALVQQQDALAVNNSGVDVPGKQDSQTVITGNDTTRQNEVLAAVTPTTGADDAKPEKNEKPAVEVKTSGLKRGILAISVVGAPNINGVSSFGDAKVGANAGVMLSLKLSKKLTVTTGAAYAYAPYNTSFKNYHTAYQFKVNPDNVFADCRVLDIPLNVDYQVYSKKGNAISLGTGLSSWFMLNEKYTFNYSGYYKGPASYSVANQNRHLFGILNLQATYQRQLNPRMGLMVQPFIKMPLTDIGYSEVRLQTAGIAAGITWKFGP